MLKLIKNLEIYESDEIPFRVIDTIGFEPTFFKEQLAINAVKDGIKELFPTLNEDLVKNTTLIMLLDELSKEDENGKRKLTGTIAGILVGLCGSLLIKKIPQKLF